MGIEILITVALASGGSVSAIYLMIFGLERNIDKRLDDLEKAIAKEQIALNHIQERILRLEDHENQEALNLRRALMQMQQWIDVVASPVDVRKDA